MALLGLDLGGTKLAVALFSPSGDILSKNTFALEGRTGAEAASLIIQSIQSYLTEDHDVRAIGISVPGIYRANRGSVWAPNIPGWEDYPLLREVEEIAGGTPVVIDSDRSCYILGEIWKGNARGCSDAIFLAVGTGIGAGIVMNGSVLSGSNGIAGAIGWMGLRQPYDEKYRQCGCFEYHASGEGIARVAREILGKRQDYKGALLRLDGEVLSARHVFAAYSEKDEVAAEVIQEAIVFWGMAVANLVSLFNPEKIVFGGGVFGPALAFLPEIEAEARKWAQPISITQVSLEPSALGTEAGVYGAGYLALKQSGLSPEYVK